MTSAENSVLEPPDLKNFLGEYTLRPPYKARAFDTRDNAPRYISILTSLKECNRNNFH